MRTSLASLTIVLMVSAVIAEKFGPEKVQVGKRKCTCSFDFTVSGGVAKGRGGCDKKCSGSVSSMSLEGEEYVFTFGMSVKKGKVAIKGAMAEPIEGSGSGPGGPGGPGSGSGGPGGPGSGSGGPGGNGDGPTGGNGGGNGGGAMSSGNCANGFVLVCPEVGGSCQEGAHQICPLEMPAGRMMPPAPSGEQDEDCMCLPLVLMQLVMARPEVMPMMRSLQDSEVLDRKAGDGDRFPTQAVQVGKKTCKCSFAFVVDGKKVKASGSCDKKCSGAVKTMELEGENFSYTFGMSVKKGKVAIKGAKATAVGGGEAITTGRPPVGGGGSGSGMPGGGMGSGCVCVMAPGGDGGQTMPTMPTPVTMPTGGSGSGSGETPITMPTIATTLAPGGNGTGTTTTTTTAPPPTTTNTTTGLRQQILADVFSVWQAFRDPLNGFWCDGLRFNYPEELVPCGPSNNFYSSAGTGMGLVSETIAVELGILTRQEGEDRVRLTIETVLSSWPRENDHGFLQHFTHRNYLPVAEYSTIDTTILALGALFAGNYFGGDVALLADTLVESVQWSDAIKAADRPRMYASTKIKNAPEMNGNVWPYNEYYLVAYLANKTSLPGSKAAQYFATYMGNDGEPPRDGVEPHPVPVNYFGHQLLSDGAGRFLSSFIPQFNYYLSRGAQTNPFYVTLFQEWMMADKLFWEKTLTADANIWGTPVAGRLWGAGAGPAPSGYGVEHINNSKDLVMSAAIMAGFLPAAGEQMREEINSQLDWLYTNEVCSYPVLQNGNTAKILWRCSARLPDWRCPSVDSIDFSSFILGYSTNFLPEDFFQTYSA